MLGVKYKIEVASLNKRKRRCKPRNRRATQPVFDTSKPPPEKIKPTHHAYEKIYGLGQRLGVSHNEIMRAAKSIGVRVAKTCRFGDFVSRTGVLFDLVIKDEGPFRLIITVIFTKVPTPSFQTS